MTPARKQNPIPGWNDIRSLKSQANLWYQVWKEAGRTIIKSSQGLRRPKCREHHLRNEFLIAAMAANDFWKDIKRIRSTNKNPTSSYISGLRNGLFQLMKLHPYGR